MAVFAVAHWAGFGAMFLAMMFLARTLGIVPFGSLAFAQVLIQHAVLLIEFGYPFSATKRIAALKDDPQALSRAFSNILACQLLLMAASWGVLAIAWCLLDDLRAPLELAMVGGTALVGSALQPTWLLLGLERLKVLASVQFASRAGMLALVLLVIEDASDLRWASFILGLPPLIGGCAILILSFSAGWVRWYPPSLRTIRTEMRDAFGMFAPGALSLFYTGVPAIVLGVVASPTAMAYFSLADRFKSAAIVAVQPFLTALIARMSVIFGQGKASAAAMVWRSLAFHACVGALLSGMLFVGADVFVVIAGGPEFAPAATVLRWIAFVPFFVCISAVASLHVLLPLGRIAAINRVVLFVGLTGLVWLVPFVIQGGEIAAAQFLLISEILSCGLMWWFASRHVRVR